MASLSRLEFNEVTFRCDTAGRIGRVEAGPSSNQPFSAFGDCLQETQGKLTEWFIDKLTEPDDPKREDVSDRQSREIFAKVVALVATAAYGVDPQAFTVFALDQLHDARFKNLPARGMDGFLFGLGETVDFRQIGIERSELPRAVQKIAAERD
jgi:hypothetical protein